MIPDKIYVGVGTLSSIQPAEEYAFPGWQEKAYSQIRNEQYIRKDALLKILTDLRDDAGVRDDQYEKDAILEYNLYDELINTVNEM